MSTTPPFAVPPTGTRHNSTSGRPSPHAGHVNVFPPQALPGRSPESALQTYSRIGTSPSSLQTGALARALTNTAIRMIGQGVNTAATALGRGQRRRPDIPRTGMLSRAEEEVLRSVEDLASKAFALFELGYERLEHWNALQRRDPALGISARTPPAANIQQISNPYAPGSSARRKSSSSSLSANSDLLILRQQEAAAGEAVVLYLKALTFIVKAIYKIQAHRAEHGGEETSPEINESECASFAAVYSRARTSSRQAVVQENGADVQWYSGFGRVSTSATRKPSWPNHDVPRNCPLSIDSCMTRPKKL